jgi:hypothetical protein
MHPEEEMTQRHTVFSCEAIDIDMPVFQNICDPSRLIIDGGKKVQLRPSKRLRFFAFQQAGTVQQAGGCFLCSLLRIGAELHIANFG